MKIRDLYIFYSDDDVARELRETLGIKSSSERTDPETVGLYEAGSASLEDQLKEVKWSDVGTGRYAVLYYIEVYEVANDDGTMSESANINHAHVIVKHATKEDLRKKDPKKVIEALTVLDESDNI